MTKKFLTLLTSSAIAMIVVSTAFSAEDNKEPESLNGMGLQKLSLKTPQYNVHEASVRFKFYMKINPQTEKEIEKKILSRFSTDTIPEVTMKKLEQDKLKGLPDVPGFLSELKEVYSTYLSTENLNSSDRYYQKAMVGSAFTLPKNEERLQKLEAIVSNASFTDRRKSFASYSIIEQETKISTDTIKILINDKKFDKDDANHKKILSKLYESYQKYEDLLNSKMSLSTQSSIKYHMVEIEYYLLQSGAVHPHGKELRLESIKEEFENIAAGKDALGFTKKLAEIFASSIGQAINAQSL